jgi:hypothetical protein
MVLTNGFDMGSTAADKYDHGGHIWHATSYLARWGGPVWESEDAYGDSFTPGGLSARKHVQDVSWYAQRSSAGDNDRIKYALTTYGATYVTMAFEGSPGGSSYYNPTTRAYYYPDGGDSNHAVLIVGWDDNYAAGNFATRPPGNGAFIVRNSWGTGWGESGYFYASYHDSAFGRDSYAATVHSAQAVTNYNAIYQYDPLGSVGGWGTGSTTTFWGANRFTATATSTLKAVGFYAEAPNTAYEIWQGPSTSSLSKVTQGTLPQMGFHTVTLPAGRALTSGVAFVVAVKLTTPGLNYPLALEYPLAGYSSAATASPGQSYVSSNGTTWTDLTTLRANYNVCIKAYAGSGSSPSQDVEAPETSASGYDSLWRKKPVRVYFSAVDRGSPPSGVAYTEYRVNSGSWTKGASVLVSTNGESTISYRSADNAGNVESERSCVVKVDSVGPVCTAKSASVKRRAVAKVYFRVTDNVSPEIKFVARITTSSGKVMKSISSGTWVEANSWWRWTFSQSLTKGKYQIRVYGLDRAGNEQRTVGKATLTVK